MDILFNALIGFIPETWQGVVIAIIALASAVAAATPTPKEGGWKFMVYKFVVDLPALNIGKAKD